MRRWLRPDPDAPIEVETFTPEEMAWVHKGGDTYERPDGKLYIFPPRRPHLIQRLRDAWGRL